MPSFQEIHSDFTVVSAQLSSLAAFILCWSYVAPWIIAFSHYNSMNQIRILVQLTDKETKAEGGRVTVSSSLCGAGAEQKLKPNSQDSEIEG